MSERWVLVPETFITRTFSAGWAHSGEGWNAEYPGDAHARPPWLAARDDALAARPPVPSEWLDAAVERGARAIWGDSEAKPWELNKDTIDGKAHRAVARAAILAALEMPDA